MMEKKKITRKKINIIIGIIVLCVIGYLILRIIPYFTPIKVKTFDGVVYKVYSDHAEVYGSDDNCNKKIVIKDCILGRDVTVIGIKAFEGAPVQEVVISNNVEIIDIGAFCHSKLRKVTFGDHVREIRNSAFNLCENIQEYNFPESLEYIGYSSIDGCYEEITIPANVSVIEEFGLSRKWCENVQFEGDDVNIQSFVLSEEYLEQYHDEFVTICHSLLVYNGDSKKIVIPDDVYYVNARFPEGSIVYLHDKVQAIEIGQVGCWDNITIYIPKSVTDFCPSMGSPSKTCKIYLENGSEIEQYLEEINQRYDVKKYDYEMIDEIVYPE